VGGESGKAVGTRKGAVSIGGEEGGKWLFEGEEFDGGAFRYLDTKVSFEGHHGESEEGEG